MNMFRVGAKAIRITPFASPIWPLSQIRQVTQIELRRRPRKKSNTVPLNDLFKTDDKAVRTRNSPRQKPQHHKSLNTTTLDESNAIIKPKTRTRHVPKPRNLQEPVVLHNKDNIRSIYELPTASQYCLSFDPTVECDKLIKASELVIKRQHQELPRRIAGKDNVRCNLHMVFEDHHFLKVDGHGTTIKEANEAANLHAICQLHRLGKLAEFLVGAEQYIDPGASKLRREIDAKTDIINYAARHDCLPVFSFHRMHRNVRNKPTYRAHVSIHQLGLNGYGRGSNVPNAILAASISLKNAAEVRHEETGDGTLLVKDYTNLTTDSSKKFVHFYCNHQRVECNTKLEETKETKTGGSWATKVILKSNVIRNHQSEVSILKPIWQPQFDPNAWPGVSQGEEDIERTYEGISMTSKADAEPVSFLAAAIALKKESAQLWEKFLKETKRGNGDILKSLSPINMNVESSTIEIIEHTLQKAAGVDQKNPCTNKSEDRTELRAQNSRQLSKSKTEKKSKDLQGRLKFYESNPSLMELRRLRLELPITQYRHQVMKMINENDVCVVVGATGSGKTTQVPQLILDELIRDGRGGSCNIICTQPRRIAAVSVAQRVAVERNERLRQSVGYSVRFDSRLPEFGGSISYCTTGVLLKQMQDSQDETLEGISHIIVDEVHDRDLNNDFLLVILKNLMEDRKSAGKPPIKVILMSATIDTSLFCKYFGDASTNKMCPYIEVPGRTFPVTTHFLDEICSELRRTYSKDTAADLYSRDSDNYISRELESSPKYSSCASPTRDFEDDESNKNRAIINWKSKGIVGDDGDADVIIDREDTLTPIGLMGVTIAHLLKTTTEGSILVFLPGLQEIVSLENLLNNTKPLGIDFRNNPDYRVYVLHSSLPQMQQDVFSKISPGQRKIILATNIAETSVTIPDVVYVVDSSKQREMQYNKSRRISSLMSGWTAKSNVQQRGGRAGRVQHGHYYTMASKARYNSFELASKPEILRTDLKSLCLQIKSSGVQDIWEFLRRAIEPPSQSAVETSIDELQALRAFDEEKNLTPLGRYLSALPLAPSIAKMVLLAAIFRCLDPILILAASSTTRNPFISPQDRRAEAERCRARWAMGTQDDHAAIINAFQEWRRLRRSSRGSWQPDRQFAHANFLHYDTLCQIARTADQILSILESSGLVQPDGENINRVTSYYGSASENMHSHSKALQTALATAGFYPNIAVRTRDRLPRFLRTVHEKSAAIFPYSLAAPRPESGRRYGRITLEDAAQPGTLFTFAEKTQTDDHGIFLRSVARTFPLAVYLFGGKTTVQGNVFTVDDWLPLYVRKRERYLLQQLNTKLQVFLDRTFSRLGASKSKQLGAGEHFLEQDKVRGPLVKGIVDALESCAPVGPLKAHAVGNNHKIYKDSNHTKLVQEIYSPPTSRGSMGSQPATTNALPREARSFYGNAEYKPYEIAERPKGFYGDGRPEELLHGTTRTSKDEKLHRRGTPRGERPSQRKSQATLLDLLNRWNK